MTNHLNFKCWNIFLKPVKNPACLKKPSKVHWNLAGEKQARKKKGLAIVLLSTKVLQYCNENRRYVWTWKKTPPHTKIARKIDCQGNSWQQPPDILTSCNRQNTVSVRIKRPSQSAAQRGPSPSSSAGCGREWRPRGQAQRGQLVPLLLHLQAVGGNGTLAGRLNVVT